MILKVFFLLSSAIILSCGSPNSKKYTLVLTYKEHQNLHDKVNSKDSKEVFTEDNNENAYSYGIQKFKSFASSWNDTTFWAPIEPLSFKVIDENNIDIRNLIDKNIIRTLDSLMWIDIKRRRQAMDKSKKDFLKKADTLHGGLRSQLDSLSKENSLPGAN